MKLTIDLYRMLRAPLIALTAGVFVLTLYQVALSSGLIVALPFALVTALICWYLYKKIMCPHGALRTVFEFTPDHLAQSVKGKQIKEIPLGAGLLVYRSLGMARAYLVFSRVEIPKGEPLGKWHKHPQVVVVPYFPRKTPKLKRYYDKAMPI